MTTAGEVMLVVEDELSEAVMRKVVSELVPSIQIDDRVIRTSGCARMRSDLQKYKNASYVYPHIVLTDLDSQECPASMLAAWNAHPVPDRMLLRVAVREVEAWLMSDRAEIARFLSIAQAKVPPIPEQIADPKEALVNLARGSRSRRLAADLVPQSGSSARQGPLYNTHLTRFAKDIWRPQVACQSAPSLARTCSRLSEFADRWGKA
jgi:hypothetical protein